MKVSKVVVTLIAINIALFAITLPLTFSQQREIIKIERKIHHVDNQMVKIESEYRGFKEVMRGISKHLSTTEARKEFKRIFRKRIEQGEVIPPGTAEHEIWSTLNGHLKGLKEELLLKSKGFLCSQFGFVPRYHDPLTILTSFFLHISLFSLFFNMLLLFIVGPILEERWGEYFLILIYLGGGIFGSLIHWMFNPLSDISTVGGGSAVAVLMGVFIVACFKKKIKFFFWFSSVFVFVLWLVQLIFQPIFEPLEVVKGQGIFAPLIVFIFGIVIGLARTGKFSKSVPEAPASPYRRLVEQGNELFGLARFDEARAVFEKVLSKEPDNLGAHEGLARLYLYKKQDKEAISEYNRVIEIAISKSYNVLEKYEAFKKVYPAVVLEPENQYRFAHILEENERFDEALEAYGKVCTTYPEDNLTPKALFAMGKIYLRLGQGKEAVDSFEKILKISPQIEWIDRVKEEIEKAKAIGH